MSLYKSLIRPIFFMFDPEVSHKLSLKLSALLRLPGLSHAAALICKVEDSKLRSEVFGLEFSNPVGVAAGVDKDCEVLDVFKTFGFGWVEAGTVTPEPQVGNPKPRMHRFPKHNALVNSMGFPSKGVEKIRASLAPFSSKREMLPVIGMNVGKNKDQEGQDAVDDYAKVVAGLDNYADFFIVNVSSPNTPGLREFQEASKLKQIFDAITDVNIHEKPVLVKLAPDLTTEQLDAALSACIDGKINGVVVTNTTISREVVTEAADLPGGVSGAPLKPRALEVVKHVYQRTEGGLPIIGIGGIASAEDAVNMFKAGASLIAIYTGLVYEGPGLAKKINKGLVSYLNKHNLASISELVGLDQQLPEAELVNA